MSVPTAIASLAMTGEVVRASTEQIQRDPSHTEFARQATPDRRLSAPTPTNALRNYKEKTDGKQGKASMLREQGVVFGPEELSLLGDVFDQALASLPAWMERVENPRAFFLGIENLIHHRDTEAQSLEDHFTTEH